MAVLDIKAIFNEAIDKPTADAGGFLDQACAGFPDVKARIERFSKPWGKPPARKKRLPSSSTPVPKLESWTQPSLPTGPVGSSAQGRSSVFINSCKN